MKQLLAGIVLILVLGVGGLVYRNVMERPGDQPAGLACPEDARMCPDGSSVARVAPSCSFAPCPFPNIQMNEIGIAFAVPQGYSEDATASSQQALRTFSKPSSTENVPHRITVSRFSIPEGKTGEEVILENTRLQPADMAPEDMSRFSLVTVGGKSFYAIVIERFEAQVESAYYLIREDEVLRFSVAERDVADWMESELIISELPEHQALLQMLETLEVSKAGS